VAQHSTPMRAVRLLPEDEAASLTYKPFRWLSAASLFRKRPVARRAGFALCCWVEGFSSLRGGHEKENREMVERIRRFFGIQHHGHNHFNVKFKDTSGAIDWGHVKTWMSFCQQHHRDLCQQSQTVPGLTVIDCKSFKVVALPSSDTPYFTLSFVVCFQA
jgi:hypothetical protein